MSRRGAHASPDGAGDAGAEARRAEREETRQVTRELHEMLQAAGDTVRALRAAQRDAVEWADALRDEVHGAIFDSIQATVDRRTKELNAHFDQGCDAITAKIADLRLLVAVSEDPEQVKDFLASTIRRLIREPEFITMVAEKVLSSRGPLAARVGPVTVQTPDADHPQTGLYIDGKYIG